jgi:hypothetical protein
VRCGEVEAGGLSLYLRPGIWWGVRWATGIPCFMLAGESNREACRWRDAS